MTRARWTMGVATVCGAALMAGEVLAGGSSQTRERLLGWTPDGKKYAVYERSSGVGSSGSVKLVKIGDTSGSTLWSCEEDACAASARSLGRLKQVRKLKLVASSAAPAGLKPYAFKSGRKIHLELRGRKLQVPVGEVKYAGTGDTTGTWKLLGVAWAPRARAVLFKVRQHVNWGDASNVTTNDGYHGFFPRAPLRPRGKAKKGLTRDRYYLSHADERVLVEITVTSTLFEGFATKYSPGYLLEPRWTWCEGARGAGIGTKIKYTFKPAIAIQALAVAPGWNHFSRQWKANNRLRRLAIRASTGLQKRVTFANQRKIFRVKLYDKATEVKWLSFEILAVHRGSSRASNDTCVSMIRPVDPSTPED